MTMESRAQIMDCCHILHPEYAPFRVTAVTHDERWWVVVWGAAGTIVRALNGSKESAEAALQDMADFLASQVWNVVDSKGHKLVK
ncbi:hypothetical protein AUEXF2481DRAFT_42489 [Aureobasidium subglaciale EXF-2481]|uniref:Uncharacterized protein n=1 Tax=Aureobasidium subglaciale (strain EXF-2481) TaxID=1043005 RepID=A0A074Y4U1_AURSE|nr:uncharacterized protein AUEXF2481DRAFT_42489 [Aureobasidium subglaciale EXF-2481]KAI5198383.1 hypothetical protein E4T38_07524 [Aureobasidium subglaciale]KAI5217168.1 hypothetical protein E4T40_07563 [Aureobasidium subglaciale]KAI5220509.1 hypothetical protein E4T41_07450 [Aureobasidium subglaciale]KAI5258317.1 hypothetical protein E4T46_07427 [Aureobasidium subglaciale]KEQ92808.1 hypothetical protein AUEXF2481DRAFT_42489 [Aureobasidium subglaciale EXF-2481]